jgi:mono/diheme cytochrome c family protein
MHPQLTRLKKLTSKFNNLGLALLTMFSVASAASLTACQSQVSVGQREAELANKEATAGKDVVLFPDAVPSVYDGKVYWEKENCASCHGAEGKGVAGQCDVDLTNAEWMRKRKPVDQYKLISFGEGREVVTPVTSVLGTAEGNELENKQSDSRVMKHEPLLDKLNKRQRWDLVFYSRSLAAPLLSEEEKLAMKAVFGANCAVCHGSRGAGDGQLNKGLVLQPAPANFTQFDRFYDRTDEQIWDHIAHGIKWEGMPNFLGKQDRGNKVTFDADYIWKLTQYVRNFHEDSAPALEGKKASRNNTGSSKAISTNIKEDAADKAHLAEELDGKQSVQ